MMRSNTFSLISCLIFLSACNLPANLPTGASPTPTASPNASPNSSPTATPTTSPSSSPSSSATPSATPQYVSTNPNVTVQQKLVMDQIISVFENSTTTLQYCYIAAEGDGRGYTAGRAGFDTRDGDLLQVIQYYLQSVPSSPLAALVPTLQALTNADSGSISGISSLPALWTQACQDPLFRQAQDYVSDQNYFFPALIRVNELNIKTQIGIMCMYDASIEHGVDGVDGVDDMISKMGSLSQYKTETALLLAFNAVRVNTLQHPADPSTQAGWSASVGRVYTLNDIINSGNMSMIPPITIDPFGDTFVITGSN